MVKEKIVAAGALGAAFLMSAGIAWAQTSPSPSPSVSPSPSPTVSASPSPSPTTGGTTVPSGAPSTGAAVE